ncbi:MAG TPA: hypothetical protein VF345_13540 [Chthoniobacterales bacterium]
MFSTWIGVLLLFAFFGLLALVVIGASPRGNTYEKKRAKVRAEKLQAVREETTKALTTYAWVDKNKGVVRIPITDAMRLTVAELAEKKPAPANPIATPAANPPGQNAAPTAASPAPSPTTSASGTPKPTSITGPNSESRNQPAAAINPPPTPPGTQPGASNAPAASPPSAAVKAPVSSSTSPSPSAPATPLPVRGKTP